MNTKEKLITSYLNIVETEGFQNISIGKLTQMVGITKSSFYCHFASAEAIEDAVIEYSLASLNQDNFKINYKANDKEELLVTLINSFIDVFSNFPNRAFLTLIESRKPNSEKFANLSKRIDLMISARITVALDFCVQRSWTDIDDTDTYAQILTPFIKNIIFSDNDPEDCIHAILKLLHANG